MFDTIVACITAPEGGAVAVLRLSGPESWEIAGHVFPTWPKEVVPRLAVYGKYTTGDDGIALPFEAGHSYTGEESAELSIHGSRASVRSLVEACVKAGARVARPGEFTERAFLNGRFDLTQAEAVRDTVEAATERQLRHANRVREGVLNRQVSEIRSRIADVLARIEATVDFSEEIGELDRPAAIEDLWEAQTHLEQLRATAETGRILRRGFRISIVGPPNSGKSSLLNALLGFERSIVTDIPGTTRDFVEEAIDLRGVPCVLVDTAGLRESEDPIERMGIERSRAAARSADIVWYVYDGSTGWRDEDEAASNSGLPVQVLANKSDLPRKGTLPRGALAVSALSGGGLANLIATVSGLADADRSEAVCINDRHAPLINAAISHIADTQKVLQTDLPVDLATVHVHVALDALGQITGETASADMLEEIFRNFCIGK